MKSGRKHEVTDVLDTLEAVGYGAFALAWLSRR